MKKLTKEQEQERNNFELKVSSIISATNLSGNDKLKKIMILYDELTALSGVGEEEDNSLLRETAMRTNIAFPENEVDTKHFDEGLDFRKSGDFMQRLFTKLELGLEDDRESNPKNPE